MYAGTQSRRPATSGSKATVIRAWAAPTIGGGSATANDLYLTTYGRSVWKIKTDFGAPVPLPSHIPGAIVDIIAGVIGDGGGLISIGGQIFRIPPRGPVRDIPGALAIEEIAQAMSKGTGHAIRLAAMQTVREIAEAQIRHLTLEH